MCTFDFIKYIVSHDPQLSSNNSKTSECYISECYISDYLATIFHVYYYFHVYYFHVSSWLTCNAGDPGSVPGLGRSPGEGNDNPLQCSCLENPKTEKLGGGL